MPRHHRLTALTLATLVAGALLVEGCATSGQGGGGATDGTPSAPLSLTGALAREGVLAREGYDLCKDTVNAKGLQIGGKPVRLDFSYQDDKSAPDTAAQLVDQFNDKGVKLVLGPYGSAATEPRGGGRAQRPDHDGQLRRR